MGRPPAEEEEDGERERDLARLDSSGRSNEVEGDEGSEMGGYEVVLNVGDTGEVGERMLGQGEGLSRLGVGGVE